MTTPQLTVENLVGDIIQNLATYLQHDDITGVSRARKGLVSLSAIAAHDESATAISSALWLVTLYLQRLRIPVEDDDD